MHIVEAGDAAFHIAEDGTLEKVIARGENGKIRELIIPEGVVRIAAGAMDMLHVAEKISFPASLR